MTEPIDLDQDEDEEWSPAMTIDHWDRLTDTVIALNNCQIECEERDFQDEAEVDEAFGRLYAAWATVREMFDLAVPRSADTIARDAARAAEDRGGNGS